MNAHTLSSRDHRRPRRRGTILILVVVLLVLLALMGTAYLTSTGSDRYATRQHSTNVETDLLLEGAKAMVQATVERDLYSNTSPAVYRPHAAVGNYEPYDDLEDDEWLASRVPEPLQDVATVYVNTETYERLDVVSHVVSGTQRYFVAYDAVPAAAAPGGAGAPWLELTDDEGNAIPGTWPVWRFVSDPDGAGPFVDVAGSAGGAHDSRSILIPWRMQYEGSYVPAFRVLGGTVSSPELRNIYAADADGDGIADSGFFIMPVGEVEGITYIASVRLIDNAAAMNLNTAWKTADDYDTYTGGSGQAPLLPGDYFPTNVDLYSALVGTNAEQTTQKTLLTQYRFNTTSGWTNDVILDDATSTGNQFKFSTPYESLWMQLGRRVWNPGYYTTTEKYLAFSIGDSMALASRFAVVDPTASPTMAEQILERSLVTNIQKGAYDLNYYNSVTDNSIANWFNNNFNYTGTTAMPLRALTVARNGVSNQAPFYTDTAGVAMVGTPATSPKIPTRADLNTADFETLWRAFYNVMADKKDIAPESAAPTADGVRSFKNSIRSATPTVKLDNFQQMQLRSALSAVAAIDMRDGDLNVTEAQITLKTGGTNPDYDVHVFGVERQPYITEVIVDQNLGTYWMAVEIHNPLPYTGYVVSDRVADPNSIQLKNLKFARIARSAMTATPITAAFPADEVLAPGEYAVLVSDLTPPANVTLPGARIYELTDLQVAAENQEEFMILRTRTHTGSATTGVDETVLLNNVPVDQYDMTGWTFDEAAVQRFHYARPSGAGNEWKFVYPGDYAVATGHARRLVTDPTEQLTGLGVADAAVVPSVSKSFTIQINSIGMAGPHKYPASPTNYFPIGGFARSGDALQVPFIGSYTIWAAGADPLTDPPVEINSVTIDSFYAENDAAPDNVEQVGRYCPISDLPGGTVDYDWAKDLFDHVTVFGTNNDYLPQANDTMYALSKQEGVANQGGTANQNEEDVPVEGLVNINTAPWYVLARLPLAVDAEGKNAAWASEALAQLIVRDRLENGPFESVFDLMRVEEFKDPSLLDPAAWQPKRGWPGGTQAARLTAIPQDPGPYNGDITPLNFRAGTPPAPDTDGVEDDFEYHFAQLIRISNLVTTRSDSFTAYVTVEGWRDPGSSNAKRITQRRAAFIIDRAAYTPLNKRLGITNFPND
jgi:hypothetical protein